MRRSTDAAFFSLLAREGVRWRGSDTGAPPWTAVRPGGLSMLAASTAALPAKDAELTAAIAAFQVYLDAEEGTPEDERGSAWPASEREAIDSEALGSHLFQLMCADDTEAGNALHQLYARDHALLLTWDVCGWMRKSHSRLGFDDCDQLSFDIEAYELGGDTLRIAFDRYGYCFIQDDTYWPPYQHVASLFQDLRCCIIVEPISCNENFHLAVLRDGERLFATFPSVKNHRTISCTGPNLRRRS